MKILITEDNPEILFFLKKGLQHESHLVDTADSGEEAWPKLLENNYDLIMLDLLLPGMSGLELLEKIRGHNITTPLIILSAIPDSETKVKLLRAGADDYIEKPFSFSEILARIQAIFKRHNPSSPEKTIILKTEDLLLNPITREVYRGERRIPLRKKEFALLEYLMQHSGEAINQSVLFQQVWGFKSSVNSNTLNSHISSLRKKVDGISTTKLIQTVHGFGYKLGR